MPEYLSKVTYSEKEGSDEYNIPFSFLTSAHVKVKQGSGENIMSTSDYSISGETLTISGTYDVPVTLYRETPGSTSATKKKPDNQFVDFNNGSVITESDLDDSTLQAIYVSQEAMDKALDAEATPGSSGNVPTPGLSQDDYILTADGTAGASVWSSTATVQGILNVSEAQAGTTIPIRNSSGSIIGDITGNVVGDVTGNADTSTVLATSRDFTTSGDVTCAAPVGFTGAAGVTLATTVAKIQGESVSASTPAEGEVFVSRSNVWTPENPNPKWVMFVQQVSGSTSGFDVTDTAKRWPVPITSSASNNTLSTVTLDTGTYVMTVPVGNYMVRWTQAFYKCNTGYVDLMQSNVSTTGTEDGVSGMLDSASNRGRSTTTYTTTDNDVHTCHGSARVEVSGGTKYWQLQAYAELGGSLGHSNASSGQFYYTTIEIVKEI